MKASSYTSSFMTADDVRKPVLLCITNISEEKVGQDMKLVLYGETESGDEKKCALNKTNIDRLIELFGDETDEWAGETVVVFRDANVMFNNRKVGGIAFRKPKNGAAITPREPAVDVRPETDDSPF